MSTFPFLFSEISRTFVLKFLCLRKYLKKGTIIIDVSTTEYEVTLDINNNLSKVGLHFLDAPVSGMSAGAKEASLSMMVGGDPTLFLQLKGALLKMASKIIHMGPVGTGQLTKLVNQLLFNINFLISFLFLDFHKLLKFML